MLDCSWSDIDSSANLYPIQGLTIQWSKNKKSVKFTLFVLDFPISTLLNWLMII